jgi:hypothetical protein
MWCSPAGHNANPMPELPGLRAARGSSRASPVGGAASPGDHLLVGDEDEFRKF